MSAADRPGDAAAIKELFERVRALERSRPRAVTSLAASGSPQLIDDVTLSPGLNVVLSQVAQDIQIAAEIEMFVANSSTDNAALGGGFPSPIDGGIQYRGWIWEGEGGGATVSHRDFGTFDGVILVPMVASDAAIVLADGVYIIVATALVTFPAQAPTREGRLSLEVSSAGVTILVHDAGKQYLEMGNSADRIETFQAVALASIVGPGGKITPMFAEDDAAGTRTGTTLSSARTLEFAVIKLRDSI